jgi:hypothetical protein
MTNRVNGSHGSSPTSSAILKTKGISKANIGGSDSLQTDFSKTDFSLNLQGTLRGPATFKQPLH